MIDLAVGESTGKPRRAERRSNKRLSYDALVALVLLSSGGEKSEAVVLRAKDISFGGLRVMGRRELALGARGAVQLMRSNGQMAVVGATVQHCQYNPDAHGYEIGLQFVALPRALSPRDFLDGKSRMKLLDPLLRSNCDE
jgi:hypothetical protein